LAHTGSGGILLVEDEKLLRWSGTRMLEKLGYTVFVAEDGRQAIEVFTRHRGEIVLVLLDLIMPEMDGRETFHRLREVEPEVKVLLASGFTQDEYVEQLLTEGARGFVEKPFDVKTLGEVIAGVLASDQEIADPSGGTQRD
jgi:CheY-like chemotaxis protein